MDTPEQNETLLGLGADRTGVVAVSIGGRDAWNLALFHEPLHHALKASPAVPASARRRRDRAWGGPDEAR